MARQWGGPYVVDRRNEMLRRAIKDRVIPGVDEVEKKADKSVVDGKADKSEMAAWKAEVEKKQLAMEERQTKMEKEREQNRQNIFLYLGTNDQKYLLASI